jgi:cell wall-associated NlpC family hydrolase
MKEVLRPAILTVSILALAAMAACTSAPRYRSSGPKPQTPPSDVKGDEVVREADNFLGVPYRSGGTTQGGVDCSGLVVTVYQKFGIAMPRTSQDQAHFGQQIDRSNLLPGDLVFFRTSGNTNITHVGIYSGDGEFIHASTRSKQVKYDRLDNKYFRKRYATARRVL